MAVRASMADLLARLRLLIADPAGDNQVFSDQELQDALDRQRSDVRYLELMAMESIAPGGAVTYLDYYADRGDWEADESLVDGSYNVLAAASADRLTGHWTFAADTEPPVYIVGKSYDLYGAAVEVLEAWAAKMALAFDMNADGANLALSQKRAGLLEMAAQYRRRGRGQVIALSRSDVG